MQYTRNSKAKTYRPLTFALFTVLGVWLACPIASPSEPPLPPKPRLLIPHDFWGPLFFESINRCAKAGHLKNLRSYCVPSGDIEVRIWSGFGLTPLEGLRLKRTKGVWSAVWFRSASSYGGVPQRTIGLPQPKSGWPDFWRQMEQGGVTGLPDASQLKNDGVNVLDGMSYVVEINRGGVYRTYCYENPEFHKHPEDKKMVKLTTLVNQEFDLNEKRKNSDVLMRRL